MSLSAGAVPMSDSSLLADLPLLASLPPESRAALIAEARHVAFLDGDAVVRAREPADALIVLASGRARVLVAGAGSNEVALGTLAPGDLIGDGSLLGDDIQSATVRALGNVSAWRFDRADVARLLAARPEIRQWLELLGTHRELAGFFRRFPAFRTLPAASLERLLGELRVRRVAAGATVVQQGDPPGSMFIVRSGHLRVWREDDGAQRPLNYLATGEWFGELSIFAHRPRFATVVANDDCELLELTPATFSALLSESPEFASAISERIAQYDYRNAARVPADFRQELLPADAQAMLGPERMVGPVPRHTQRLSSRLSARVSLAAVAAASDDSAGSEVDAEDAEPPRRGPKRTRVPFVAQIDEMDCGAACLGMICRAFGRAVSLTRIRELAHTSVDGTSLRAIVTAAEQLGLAARAVKATAEVANEMPVPAILHWDGVHWVVLERVNATHAWILDPGRGRRKISRAEFAERWSGYAALFDYTEAFEAAPVTKQSWAWLVPFFTPHLGLLARALGLAGLMSALQLALPVFSQVIVDRVLVDSDAQLLSIVVIGMFTVLAMSLGASLLQRYVLSWVAVRFDTASLDYLTRVMLALPMRYFAARRTGDIQRRLAGMQQVRDFLVQHAIGGLSAIVQLIAAVVLMLLYSPLLALVSFSMVPGYILLLWYSRVKLRPMFDSLEEASARYASYQIDAVKGIETVKALGGEGALRELMLGEFFRVSRQRFQSNFTLLAYDGVTHVMGFVTSALVLWVGASRVLTGQLTIGGFVAFNGLVALANGPLQELLGLWDSMQHLSVLLNRLQDVLEPEPEQGRDRSQLRVLKTLEGRISLEGVAFRYGGPESAAILDDLSVDIASGTRVAIVGRSGSGKTTLMKLLSGLLTPSAGRILLDGHDQAALDLRSVRRHIGFVLQDDHIFNDTIARNIAFGEREPDLDAVMWAARAAAAHEFIERLPFGYDTKIGESGLALSGGQRQRISIARALYRRPPIILLDEATSALDTESERTVKENLDRLLRGRTSLVIAHRLSTVRDADRILVLDRGRLVEDGSHEALLAQRGLYFYLVSQQLDL